MALINDKDTAKQFVNINYINSESSLPDFDLAAERYLIPIIGKNYYDELVDNIADPEYASLLKLCRAVIAPLGYMMELPTIQTQLTDAGLRSINSDHFAAAHRWEYNEVKDGLQDKGAYAIESLLKFLFAENYETWTDGEEYAEMNKLIFKTGAEFNKFFTVHHPHRVFWELRPLMMEVQDIYIASTIGNDFFVYLKDKADPTDIEKQAILLVKKAVAQYTIVKAIEKLTVKKTVNGFTVLLSAGSTDSSNAGDAEQKAPELDLLYKTCTRTGDQYLLQLKEWLDKNASATVMQEYYESSYYTNPNTVTVNRNEGKKVFGL